MSAAAGRRVIVTRPQAEAGRWLEGLRAAGLQAIALPLIEIGPPPDPAVVAHWRAHWDHVDALMFVSAAAVAAFWPDACPPALAQEDPAGRKGPRLWTTGPGTMRALTARGVPTARIDRPADDAAQFDSETLWARVRTQVTPGSRVLIVRGDSDAGRPGNGAEAVDSGAGRHRSSADDQGGHDAKHEAAAVGQGRDWLATQCRRAGARVDWCVAYARTCPRWSAADLALAQAASTDGSVWLFSSTEALHNLARLCPSTSWAAARAVATHPRIAQAAREAGFGRVEQSHPGLPALVQILESGA